MSKRSIATIALLAALLAGAAPAHAGTSVGNPGKVSGVIEPGLVFSGDAYDNEMGFRAGPGSDVLSDRR